MACVIDHLLKDHWVTVLQDFRDARGTAHHAGETAVLRSMDFDWQRQEIVIEWERDQKAETLYFAVAAKDGPGNGRMRQYFALGDRVPLPEDTNEGRRKLAMPMQIPDLVRTPVTDPVRYHEAVERVWALAARERFDEAEAQVRLITDAPDPCGGRLQSLASDLVGIAVTHASDNDPAVYEWARHRAISLWYAWGASATSGGEGAARMQEIRAAEARLEACETRRR